MSWFFRVCSEERKLWTLNYCSAYPPKKVQTRRMVLQCLVLIRGWGFTEWQIWLEGCCPSKATWSGDYPRWICSLMHLMTCLLLQWLRGQQVRHIPSATSRLWGTSTLIQPHMTNCIVLFFVCYFVPAHVLCQRWMLSTLSSFQTILDMQKEFVVR